MSFSAPEDNLAWVEEEGFPFEVWEDLDQALALYYGAIDRRGEAAPDRITKILDSEGTLILEYVEGVSAGTNPEEVLGDCQQLFGG